MQGEQLVVNRWRRYGKDRLYVEDGAGAKIGWWDLVVDEGHPASPEHTEALSAAVGHWRTAHAPGPASPSAPSSPPELEPEPSASSAEAEPVVVPARPWTDLATNVPGAEAREQALAARDAAPVKTLLARALRVHNDERAWRIGADGEEKVAAQLRKVAAKDPRWRFLHAIPVGSRGADIDHLVVGPGGVFTVNAKHHPKAKIWVGGSTFLVNGTKQPYVRNSRHEAARAAKLLSAATGRPVHVEGLVVTVNAADVVVKSRPEGVHVVPRMQVKRLLLRLGDVLTEEQVAVVYEAARRSTTWR